MSATEHRWACAGFSTPVLAVAKASAEPLLTVTSNKSRTERAPAGAQKAPKSTEPKSTVIGDPKETKKYRKILKNFRPFLSSIAHNINRVNEKNYQKVPKISHQNRGVGVAE